MLISLRLARSSVKIMVDPIYEEILKKIHVLLEETLY